MSNQDFREHVDARIDDAGRRGLTGTTPASVYAAPADRDSITVAPDFRPREQIAELRPQSMPVNTFQFGAQTITTQVQMMVPRRLTQPAAHVDVTAAMDEEPRARAVSLRVVPAPDPFAEVEV